MSCGYDPTTQKVDPRLAPPGLLLALGAWIDACCNNDTIPDEKIDEIKQLASKDFQNSSGRGVDQSKTKQQNGENGQKGLSSWWVSRFMGADSCCSCDNSFNASTLATLEQDPNTIGRCATDITEESGVMKQVGSNVQIEVDPELAFQLQQNNVENEAKKMQEPSMPALDSDGERNEWLTYWMDIESVVHGVGKTSTATDEQESPKVLESAHDGKHNTLAAIEVASFEGGQTDIVVKDEFVAATEAASSKADQSEWNGDGEALTAAEAESVTIDENDEAMKESQATGVAASLSTTNDTEDIAKVEDEAPREIEQQVSEDIMGHEPDEIQNVTIDDTTIRKEENAYPIIQDERITSQEEHRGDEYGQGQGLDSKLGGNYESVPNLFDEREPAAEQSQDNDDTAHRVDNLVVGGTSGDDTAEELKKTGTETNILKPLSETVSVENQLLGDKMRPIDDQSSSTEKNSLDCATLPTELKKLVDFLRQPSGEKPYSVKKEEMADNENLSAADHQPSPDELIISIDSVLSLAKEKKDDDEETLLDSLKVKAKRILQTSELEQEINRIIQASEDLCGPIGGRLSVCFYGYCECSTDKFDDSISVLADEPTQKSKEQPSGVTVDLQPTSPRQNPSEQSSVLTENPKNSSPEQNIEQPTMLSGTPQHKSPAQEITEQLGAKNEKLEQSPLGQSLARLLSSCHDACSQDIAQSTSRTEPSTQQLGAKNENLEGSTIGESLARLLSSCRDSFNQGIARPSSQIEPSNQRPRAKEDNLERTPLGVSLAVLLSSCQDTYSQVSVDISKHLETLSASSPPQQDNETDQDEARILPSSHAFETCQDEAQIEAVSTNRDILESESHMSVVGVYFSPSNDFPGKVVTSNDWQYALSPAEERNDDCGANSQFDSREDNSVVDEGRSNLPYSSPSASTKKKNSGLAKEDRPDIEKKPKSWRIRGFSKKNREKATRRENTKKMRTKKGGWFSKKSQIPHLVSIEEEGGMGSF